MCHVSIISDLQQDLDSKKISFQNETLSYKLSFLFVKKTLQMVTDCSPHVLLCLKLFYMCAE